MYVQLFVTIKMICMPLPVMHATNNKEYLLLTSQDPSQADQPNSLAEGPPMEIWIHQLASPCYAHHHQQG